MNNECETYRCIRCGKRFTKFGRQAEILYTVNKLLTEYRRIIDDHNGKKVKYTDLNIVEAEAKCCKNPLILHTYPEKGDLR